MRKWRERGNSYSPRLPSGNLDSVWGISTHQGSTCFSQTFKRDYMSMSISSVNFTAFKKYSRWNQNYPDAQKTKYYLTITPRRDLLRWKNKRLLRSCRGRCLWPFMELSWCATERFIQTGVLGSKAGLGNNWIRFVFHICELRTSSRKGRGRYDQGESNGGCHLQNVRDKSSNCKEMACPSPLLHFPLRFLVVVSSWGYRINKPGARCKILTVRSSWGFKPLWGFAIWPS